MADEGVARRYHRLQLLLGLLGLVLGLAYLLVVLSTRAAGLLADAAGGPWWWQVPVVAAALGVAYRLLTFPLAWVRGWWLPRRYGLLHQPLAAWLGDRVKALALGAVIGLVAIEVVYALLRASTYWWLWAAGVFFVLQVALTIVVPVWVVPLFYRLTPLDDEALRTRLVALAERAGVRVLGVWMADQSRKSRTANAALTGLGRTRRIILFDTLAVQFAPDEIEAVLAHELGHHVHRDIWRGLVANALLSVVTLGIADILLRAGVRLWGFAGPADAAAVPWLALVLGGLGLAAAPLMNGFSRRLERQADDFALRTTGNPAAFIGAMERLADLNLAERRPSRLKELVLYSHPAIERRIARARNFRATGIPTSA
jgi:STE24 endopeptidase